jgi:predicted TIM-barrel enzyme
VGIATLVGSGITIDNVADYPDADALIVGSWIKKDGLWSNPIDPARAERLVQAFRTLR